VPERRDTGAGLEGQRRVAEAVFRALHDRVFAGQRIYGSS
jgi:hypothetical protein